MNEVARFQPALRGVRLLVLDVDGVLTDGRLFYGAKGEALKAFHVRDGHGIKRVAATPATRLLEGHPIRGLSVEVDLDEENFGSEGEAYLFGAILDEFFSQYVSLNAFVRLIVKGVKYGEIHAWPTRTGDRIIL